MRPAAIRTRVRPAPVMTGLWALLAAAAIVQLLAERAAGFANAIVVRQDAALIILWALAVPAIFWAAGRFPIRGDRRRRRALGHLTAAVAFIVAGNVAIRLPVLGATPAMLRDTVLGIARFGPAALVIYAAILAAAHAAMHPPAPQGAETPVPASPAPRAGAPDFPVPIPQSRHAEAPHSPFPIPDSPNARIQVRHWNRRYFLEPAAIDWIEADGNNVVVRAGSHIYKGRGRIGDYEARLGGAFARVHRSALVRVAAVQAVEPLGKGDLAIRLPGDKTIRVARGRRATLEAALGPPPLTRGGHRPPGRYSAAR